jgi:hypothetical protein
MHVTAENTLMLVVLVDTGGTVAVVIEDPTVIVNVDVLKEILDVVTIARVVTDKRPLLAVIVVRQQQVLVVRAAQNGSQEDVTTRVHLVIANLA